jgi:hypothetical protein
MNTPKYNNSVYSNFSKHSKLKGLVNSISIAGSNNALVESRVQRKTEYPYSYNAGKKCIENISRMKSTITFIASTIFVRLYISSSA